MCSYQYSIFFLISVIFGCINSQYGNLLSNYLHQTYSALKPITRDLYLMQDKLRLILTPQQNEKVKIQLYYECMCPDCRIFDVQYFAPTVKKLGEYLDIHVYPYGNAKTIINKEGKVEINCQHGPAECYGNMLHACAIDNLRNLTAAIYFNSCMMDSQQANKGSDDLAADKCGILMNVDTAPIKSCAKGPRGFVLLKSYGELSKKAGFKAVPYILINGVENDGSNFFQDVCAAFTNPPDECNELY